VIAELRPEAAETAVFNLPPGTTVRLIRDGEVHDYPPLDNEGRQIGCIPAAAFGGVRFFCQCIIRNGRHKRDRALWREADRAARQHGIAYVGHEQRDWYGRQVWVAVRVRRANKEIAGA
jgi:hypothetical protein